MNRTIRLISRGALLAAFFAASAAAQVFPAYLNYQGKLSNSAGSPLSGTYSFGFTLYSQASGGSFIFQDLNYTAGNAVSVSNGVYSVQIGSMTPGGIPPSVFFNSEVWLEVTIGQGSTNTSPETLAPRERLTSSPFSFLALNAEHLSAGVAIATFTTAGNLQLPYGVTAATAAFSGSVGIGTTNPQAALEMAGPLGADLRIDVSGPVTTVLSGSSVLYKLKP